MLDFTSALYLGIQHPSRALRPWSQLTIGKPATLGSPPGTQAVAKGLAELVGCERVTLMPSALHLFFDLFEVLRREGMILYVDAAAYPMARWGAERAAARGVLLRKIPHYDPVAARYIIERDGASGTRPVILADGFCPECGRAVPLLDYLNCVTPDSGYVVLDDTQALGVWGRTPDRLNPYGSGGGGSLQLQSIRSPAVIVGSSLAKGFGVPLAMLGGNATLIRRFIQRSETRVHASPPSSAELNAAEHALMVNAVHGDAIRRHLAEIVIYFQNEIRRIGFPGSRNPFPVQMLATDPNRPLIRLHRMLRAGGVRTVVVRKRTAPGVKLMFVFNALQSTDDVDRAVSTLTAAIDKLFTGL